MTQKKQSFENSLAELEKIVGRLEQGDLALDESLELFEKGVKLSRECQERLSQAERRIEVLLNDRSGGSTLKEIDEQQIESVEVQTQVATVKQTSVQTHEKRIVFDSDDEEDDDVPF